MKMVLDNATSYAKYRGYSRGYISDLFKRDDWRIVKCGRKIDRLGTDENIPPKQKKKKVVASKKAVEQIIEESFENEKELDEKDERELEQELEDETGEETEDDIPSQNESRKVKEYYQARKEKLKYYIEKGEYVKKETVKQDIYESSRKIRDCILKIPSIVSAIVPEDIRHDVEVLANKQIKEALEILVKDIANE